MEEMGKVDGRVEHHTSQQKILMEVLEDSRTFSDIFESLAHLKNEKSQL